MAKYKKGQKIVMDIQDVKRVVVSRNYKTFSDIMYKISTDKNGR